MPKQPALPGLRDAMKKKVTRREQFLAEMDAVVPWGRLLALVAPHYPKVGPKGGRPPMALETMLRVYFLQNWLSAISTHGTVWPNCVVEGLWLILTPHEGGDEKEPRGDEVACRAGSEGYPAGCAQAAVVRR